MSGPRSRRAHVPPSSMQRARYLWLAPSTDSDSCSHLFCLRRLKRHQGTDFSSICRKEFDYGKTPSLYPPFHPLLHPLQGGRAAPRSFCKITEAVAELVRKRGAGMNFHVEVFVDDFGVVGDDLETREHS